MYSKDEIRAADTRKVSQWTVELAIDNSHLVSTQQNSFSTLTLSESKIFVYLAKKFPCFPVNVI
jgi:hypothetical protein